VANWYHGRMVRLRLRHAACMLLPAVSLAVADYRASFNVTDYRWFDLRDSNSSDPDFQQHYGLTHDDYSRKPAFGAYRELIASLGRRSTTR
jgi:hypothetical protein